MKFVRDAKEKGTTIVLDGYSFVNCQFADCKLLYAGGDFAWENTTFVNCQLGFQAEAQRTITLLQFFGLYKQPTEPVKPTGSSTGIVH